jgi:hypothetical protein
MTTRTFPYGIGVPKPDLVTVGEQLMGASLSGANPCRLLSGTSVAAPVVSGSLALLGSLIKKRVAMEWAELDGGHRDDLVPPYELNHALFKQIVMHSATILQNVDGPSDNSYYDGMNEYDYSMFGQGSGALDLERAFAVIADEGHIFDLFALTSFPPNLFLNRHRSGSKPIKVTDGEISSDHSPIFAEWIRINAEEYAPRVAKKRRVVVADGPEFIVPCGAYQRSAFFARHGGVLLAIR